MNTLSIIKNIEELYYLLSGYVTYSEIDKVSNKLIKTIKLDKDTSSIVMDFLYGDRRKESKIKFSKVIIQLNQYIGSRNHMQNKQKCFVNSIRSYYRYHKLPFYKYILIHIHNLLTCKECKISECKWHCKNCENFYFYFYGFDYTHYICNASCENCEYYKCQCNK